jgi:parallel beta-helix repeat protein
MRLIQTMALAAVGLAAVTAHADTIYVCWDGSGDYLTIQEGIDAALDGDEVVICDGTYTGALNKDLDFGGRLITVRSENGPDNCIIDCEASESDTHRGFYFHSGETAQAVVQGLTIRNGYVDEGSPGGGSGGAVCCVSSSSATLTDCTIADNTAGNDAGGVYCCDYSSAALTNCTISDNTAGNDGGGMHCWDYSSATLTDCTISGNTAGNYGGGVCTWNYCSVTLTNCMITGNTSYGIHGGGGMRIAWHSSATLTDCTISSNTGRHGGGIYFYEFGSSTLTNCTIAANTAETWGGGLACNCSIPRLTNCTITGNTCSAHGGGILCYHSSPSLTGCTITGNRAANGGGVCIREYSDPALTNCTISGNTADNDGGAVVCHGYGHSNPTLTNCTIAANWATNGRALACTYDNQEWNAFVVMANCILWDGGNEIWNNGSSTIRITFSDVQNGWSGMGNIDADPLFVDPDGPDNDPNTPEDNNYRLSGNSPCIDAGSNHSVPADTLDLDGDGDTAELIPLDLDGRLRFADRIDTPDSGFAEPNYPDLPIVDMGAYEYQCDGDLDGDGDIDLTDLAQLLANYGTSMTVYADGDIDGDGDVDLSDLAALLSVYGTTCP